jgi:serine/threonine protein kinase
MVVEALTGQRPFVGHTSAELITAILSAPFHLPGEAPPEGRLDELRKLDAVLQRCLAKDRGQRFDSVAAMQHELIPAIEHCPALAPAVAASIATMDSEDATMLKRLNLPE